MKLGKILFAQTMLFLCLSALLIGNQAQAQSGGERITDYRVAIAVKTDRSVEITETIEINARGSIFKRGLLRDIPVRYRAENGLNIDIDLEITSILRNGAAEPFALSYDGRYARLRIGDADVFLNHGRHRYEIRYRVQDSIGFFEAYDEIYWNAIGTEWPFRIDQAKVSVLLPEGAEMGDYAIYTGKAGSRGDRYSVTRRSERELVATATHPFAPGEGMTIAVNWQKGLIPPPSNADVMKDSIIDNSPLFALILAAFLQIGWLYRAWLKVGRDPEGGAIIPRYRAPGDLSPAIASYVSGLGSFEKGNNASFMAALINLAIKGFVKIDDEGSDLTIKRERRQDEIGPLPVGERALFSKLFSFRDTATFADMKYDTMSGVMSAFADAVNAETDQVYFRRNAGYMVPGFLLAFLGIAAFVFGSILLAPPFQFPLVEVFAAAMIVALVLIVRAIVQLATGRRTVRLRKFLLPAGFVLVFFSAVGFFESSAGPDSMGFLWPFKQFASFMWQNSFAWNLLASCAIAAMILALVFFSHWMKAPTKLGREMLDEIEGLKLFMTVTAVEQAEQAARADMPELTPKLYEDLLPYAIALGLERRWSALFEEKVFSQLPPEKAYHPHWYRGRFDRSRPTATLSAMTDTLGTDLSSAMTPPASSSSGSSGGGFSGGGGGGGGGGGW